MSLLAQQSTNSFSSSFYIALISAVVGFAFALLLDWIKAQREPRKQLSWTVDRGEGLFGVRPDIREKVKVLYNYEQVDSLSVVHCRITNTGNSVVKSEQVRFSFPPEVRMLEHVLDPEPERELGVTERVEAKKSDNEAIYLIAHLERGWEVGFQFVLDGAVSTDWSPRDFNEDGNVTFVRRDVARVRKDQEHLQPFFVILLLSFVVPPIFSNLPSVGSFLENISRVLFVVLLVPHAVPVARVFAVLINSLSTRRALVDVRDASAVQIGDGNLQRNYYRRSEEQDD